MKSSEATSRLGWVWWILDPLCMMLIYYFVVKVVFNLGGENYHLFALIGITCWQFFCRNLRITTGCLRRNIALMRQVNIPAELYAVSSGFVQFFFSLITTGIILVWNHEVVSLYSVSSIGILLLILLYSFALGLMFSVAVAYFPDVEKFLDYALRALFFFSPILYSVDKVLLSDKIPEWGKMLFSIYPISWIISSMREILLYGNKIDASEFLAQLVVALVLLQVSLIWFRKQTPEAKKRL